MAIDSERTLMLPAWIRVLLPDGRIEEMKLETYLAGAVAAEIGADAPLEALKAQAVASRTYVVSTRRHPEHNADVCIAPHCQLWKRVDPVSAPEVFRALTETWGIVALHEGELINAFFFEHCDGHTRNAEEMLMPAFPYLRAVDCPCGFLTLKGHGVGVCKRGAIVMARRGASYAQILEHYYRGVEIVRASVERQTQPEREEIKPPSAFTPGKKPRGAKLEPAPLKRREEPKPARSKISPPAETEKFKTPVKPKPQSPTQLPKPASRPLIPFTPKRSEPVSDIPPAAVAQKPPVEMPRPPIEPAPPPIEMPASKVEPIVDIEPTPVIVEPSTPFIVPIETPAPIEPAAIVVQTETSPMVQPAKPPFPADETTAPVESGVTEIASVETPVQIPGLPLVTQEIEPSPFELPALEESPMTAEPAMAMSEPPIFSAEELPALEESFESVAPRVQIDHLPGERMIAGCVEFIGAPISIVDANGNQTIVFSGSAPHYGEGGFETIVQESGWYTVAIDGLSVQVEVQDETVFIHTN